MVCKVIMMHVFWMVRIQIQGVYYNTIFCKKSGIAIFLIIAPQLKEKQRDINTRWNTLLISTSFIAPGHSYLFGLEDTSHCNKKRIDVSVVSTTTNKIVTNNNTAHIINVDELLVLLLLCWYALLWWYVDWWKETTRIEQLHTILLYFTKLYN